MKRTESVTRTEDLHIIVPVPFPGITEGDIS